MAKERLEVETREDRALRGEAQAERMLKESIEAGDYLGAFYWIRALRQYREWLGSIGRDPAVGSGTDPQQPAVDREGGKGA